MQPSSKANVQESLLKGFTPTALWEFPPENLPVSESFSKFFCLRSAFLIHTESKMVKPQEGLI